jgi:hypothetical protein
MNTNTKAILIAKLALKNSNASSLEDVWFILFWLAFAQTRQIKSILLKGAG